MNEILDLRHSLVLWRGNYGDNCLNPSDADMFVPPG